MSTIDAQASPESSRLIAQGVDEEASAANERGLTGWQYHLVFVAGIAFTLFHLIVLNVFPLETWTFRILHVAFGLALGYAVTGALSLHLSRTDKCLSGSERGILLIVATTGTLALSSVLYAFFLRYGLDTNKVPTWVFQYFGPLLAVSVVFSIVSSWIFRPHGHEIIWSDWFLILGSLSVAGYLLFNLNALQFRAGVMPTPPDFWAAMVGILLILELTRRVAGLALVVIAIIFILYAFVGPYLPSFLNHSGYNADRFFTYLYTDNGILGPTTAVSSTYIVLFIAFAAFLQASKVGDYFVNFAFAIAGQARGGPAKVAVFASGLMGMINGTSAGNVVATGSLTIPLMKRVGYRPQSAAAIEATASTGGQIMPPIMGAGAFIMAEVTGIPYTELIIAALIPAVLYFLSIFFMVDLEARRADMKPLSKDELPILSDLLKQIYLFIPILILIGALFLGYSVIRAGTLALASAIVVSWLSPHKMGPRSMLNALNMSARMSIQLIAVCACAGIIVGVIGLTGVGLRFSSMLLQIASTSQLLALIFAMGISMLLGMGMPTTAAYAVAASVVAPGLIQLGISPLVAHFFVFYYAVISAITPPVALAAYAGAAIAGSEPMRTSVTAFKLGIAAFIIPFMFFYSPGLLMEDTTLVIARNLITAVFGVYFLAAAVQGWFLGRANTLSRFILLIAALCMISGGWVTDVVGIALAIGAWLLQTISNKNDVKPTTVHA